MGAYLGGKMKLFTQKVGQMKVTVENVLDLSRALKGCKLIETTKGREIWKTRGVYTGTPIFGVVDRVKNTLEWCATQSGAHEFIDPNVAVDRKTARSYGSTITKIKAALRVASSVSVRA